VSPGTRELESRRKVQQTPNLENAHPELKNLLQVFPVSCYHRMAPFHPSFFLPCLQHLTRSLLFSLQLKSLSVFVNSHPVSHAHSVLAFSTFHSPAWQKMLLKLKLLLTLITPTPSQKPALPSLCLRIQVNPSSLCIFSPTALCSSRFHTSFSTPI